MKRRYDMPVTFTIPSQNEIVNLAAPSQAVLPVDKPTITQKSKEPVFPDWTRMPSHYATFQEFQSDRSLSVWRIEEAMYQLLGRGYSQNLRLPLD